MSRHFRVGSDVLLGGPDGPLAGRRVVLLSHAAAVCASGCLTADRLHRGSGARLVGLMGPEHGFLGTAGAGVACRSARHPDWQIPVHSLYGATRKPTPCMLRGADVLLVDLQDIAARCYTYVSTLQLALEAASENSLPVVVADRPIPLPNTVDGPVTESRFSSFVGLVDTPLAYGMTPGETARWIAAHLGLDLDLTVVRMAGYRRQPGRDASWPPWVPPSPAMLSWESARCFPATVCFEAIPAVDHGRGTNLPFQLVGAPWIRGVALASALNERRLPGVRFHAHRYDRTPRQPTPRVVEGVRLAVTEPDRFLPAVTAVHMLDALQRLYGRRRVWRGSRREWLDKLFATDTVREALLDGEAPDRIVAAWQPGLRRFRRTRAQALLYG
jgi:uncharacterized protein YbbC (DUF1343 family)